MQMQHSVVHGGSVLVPGRAGGQLVEADVLIARGRIREVRHREPVAVRSAGDAVSEQVGDASIIDATGMLVLPGLVNSHTHSYGQVAREPFADDWLEPWMPRAMAAWSGASEEAFGLAATLTAADALRRGITTIVDHATLDPSVLDAVITAYECSGLRVHLALQMGDLPFADWTPSALDDLAPSIAAADPYGRRSSNELLELLDQAIERLVGHDQITLMVGPSAPERCSDALLAGLGERAQAHRLPVHTHLLEVPSQRVWGDATARLVDHGLLHATATVAHAVHLDPRDCERLQAAGAGVALNPFSNAALGCRRVAPAAAMRAAGLAVGVGTDGFNCGGGQDLLAAARWAMVAERSALDPAEWPTPHDAWDTATSALSSQLGAPHLGRVVKGGPADLLLVDPDLAGWVRSSDPTTEAVLGGFGAGLRHVVVAGRVVLADGVLRSVDVVGSVRRARRAGSELATRNAELSRRVTEALAPALSQLSRRAAGLTSA